MANRFWNPSWNSNWWDANVWATTDWWDPTWVATPTSSDDVFFTSTNSYTCTVAATANCNNLDFTWFVWTFYARWPQTINIYWNLLFTSWMTLDLYANINLLSTSTWKTITSNWKKINWTLTINWISWEYTLQDNWENNWDFIVSAWSLITNNKTLKCSLLDVSWTDAKNINLWSSAITCVWWRILNSTNLTFNSWTSTINISWIYLTWWWLTYYNIWHSPSWTTATLAWENIFNNLTITWRANLLASYSISNNQTISWTLTINWNSAINRLLILSDTKWTQRTITCNWTVSVSNADFQDIKWAWSWSWDLSSATWWSWDCWWNTDITFTTPTTTTCSAGTTWSTATWDVRVPLPQDTANFSWSSRTITQDMPRIWSVDFTWSSWLTWTTSTACSVFWSINLTDLATLTASTQVYTFEGRWSNTLTSAWKTWSKSITIDIVSWTISLWDKLTTSVDRTLNITSWTFNANNNDLTIWILNSSNSNIRTITCWSWTWEITANWDMIVFTTITNLTFNKNTSTFKITWNLVSWNSIRLWWLTYYNFWLSGTTTVAPNIIWNNTFNDFKVDAWLSFKLIASSTQTVNTFTAIWTSESPITIRSSTTTNATLAKAWWGTIQCEYIDIDYITWSPDETWYMWDNSTDWTHNSQIYFTNAPATATWNFFMFF